MVACPANTTAFTVGGVARRRPRYSAMGQGELPSCPTATVVIPCETCVTAAGSTSSPEVE